MYSTRTYTHLLVKIYFILQNIICVIIVCVNVDNSAILQIVVGLEVASILYIVICNVEKKVHNLWKSKKMVWKTQKVIHIDPFLKSAILLFFSPCRSKCVKMGFAVEKLSTYPHKNVDNSRILGNLKKSVKNACNLIFRGL